MYPSSNSNCNTSFSTIFQPRTSFCNYNHENHSKPYQDHSSSSLFHLYYPHYIPLEDEPIIRELFQQKHDTIVAHEHSTVDGGHHSNSHVNLENNCLTVKSSSKKDRHSKINTARGPRDRRMRLSLDVAKKFFRLQDMLGFDKASNTVKWLLMKSEPAIQDLHPQQLNQSCSLMGVSHSSSSTSECEVLSGFDDQSMIIEAKSSSSGSNKEKKKLEKGVSKTAYIHHSLAKETREKARARARARKRTTEKRNNKLGCSGAGCDQYSNFRPSLDQVMNRNLYRLGSWIPLGENQVQTTDQPEYPSSHFQFKQGIVGGNASLMSGNWSPSSFFNYQQNPGPSHEHQLSDFQILGKPWEGNNS